MKATILIFILLALAPLGRADDLADTVNVMNYPLYRVFAPNQTYAGTLVDAKPVTVMSAVRGLLPGLTLGLTNAVLGTRIGARKVTVFQYVVRLDAPLGGVASLVTVIQGGPGMLKPGIPVFLATETDYYGQVCSTRVIAALTPGAYMNCGLEERRLEAKARKHAPQQVASVQPSRGGTGVVPSYPPSVAYSQGLAGYPRVSSPSPNLR